MDWKIVKCGVVGLGRQRNYFFECHSSETGEGFTS